MGQVDLQLIQLARIGSVNQLPISGIDLDMGIPQIGITAPLKEDGSGGGIGVEGECTKGYSRGQVDRCTSRDGGGEGRTYGVGDHRRIEIEIDRGPVLCHGSRDQTWVRVDLE